MELDLTRVELLQTGLTSGRTMRLLPGKMKNEHNAEIKPVIVIGLIKELS